MNVEQADEILWDHYDCYKAHVRSALIALSKKLDYSSDELLIKLAQSLQEGN